MARDKCSSRETRKGSAPETSSAATQTRGAWPPHRWPPDDRHHVPGCSALRVCDARGWDQSVWCLSSRCSGQGPGKAQRCRKGEAPRGPPSGTLRAQSSVRLHTQPGRQDEAPGQRRATGSTQGLANDAAAWMLCTGPDLGAGALAGGNWDCGRVCPSPGPRPAPRAPPSPWPSRVPRGKGGLTFPSSLGMSTFS